MGCPFGHTPEAAERTPAVWEVRSARFARLGRSARASFRGAQTLRGESAAARCGFRGPSSWPPLSAIDVNFPDALSGSWPPLEDSQRATQNCSYGEVVGNPIQLALER